jgi:CIC family chloride channel protein
VLGDEPLFHVAAYHLVHPVEFVAYAVLGIVGGFGSVGFVKLLLALRKRFAALPRRTLWLQPAIGGLVVGLLGFVVPQVLGVGYDQVDKVLSGDVVLKMAILLAVLKIIATAVAYASGNAGGIFGPSLFIGSMMGAAVGRIAHLALPADTAGAGAYALVGMGTAFAGIIRTPLTSVIMIFELTRDYAIIVPLMISNMIAFWISQKLQHEPIYEALARQDGLHLPGAGLRQQAGRLRVSRAIRAAPQALPHDLSLTEALQRIGEGEAGSWLVADREGLVGLVRRSDIAAAVGLGGDSSTVGQLLRQTAEGADGVEGFAHVHSDEQLSQALARMGESGHTVLPVVSRANVRVVLGVVTLRDILRAYGVERGEPSTPGRPSR